MSKTGHEVSDLGRSLSWGALQAFLKNIGADSALARGMNPELAAWSTTTKTNAILADIFDLLATINANIIGMASHKRAKPPKAYPRPGAKPEDERKFGRGAVPVDDLRKWIAEKRRG